MDFQLPTLGYRPQDQVPPATLPDGPALFGSMSDYRPPAQAPPVTTPSVPVLRPGDAVKIETDGGLIECTITAVTPSTVSVELDPVEP